MSAEQYRGKIAKLWPADLVDKVLYLISGESGGRADAVGDGGAAYGLFQSHYVRPGASVDEQIADAHRLWKADLANGGTGFGDWGEGRLYEGKPFGALGNHPYSGRSTLEYVPGRDDSGMVTLPEKPGVVNGKQPLADDVKPVDPLVQALYNLTHTWPLKTGLPKETPKMTTKPTSGRTYQPPVSTGTFKGDVAQWFAVMQAADAQLQKYMQTSPSAFSVDDKSGLVSKVVIGEDGSQTLEVDPEATKLYQGYLNASQNLDRLYEGKKSGLFDNGESAAAAWLASEKDKAAEADREYSNFIKRISDLVTLENVPISRAQTLASTLSAITDQKAKRQSKYEQYASAPPASMTQYTDLGGVTKDLASGLGSGVPKGYNIDPGSLAPAPSASTAVPSLKPEEVLAKYGITLPRTQTGVVAPGGVSPHDTTPPSGIEDIIQQAQGMPHQGFNTPSDATVHSAPDALGGLDDIISSLIGAIPGLDTSTRKRVPAKSYGGR